MILDFIDSKLKKNIQNGGDGYTIDVSKSINGMVGWSRYSFNYAPIIYGDLLPCENKKVLTGGSDTCGCVKQTNEPKSVYELLQQNGGNKIKTNQFDAIQQVGKGLLPLSPNNLINLILLIFLYHSVVDSNVDNKKIKQTIKKGGNNLISIIAPLGRGNLLVLSSLLLLHHFAVEKPSLKKQLKGGNNNIYEQMNKILEPLGLKKVRKDGKIYYQSISKDPRRGEGNKVMFKDNFADGKKPGRKGISKRVGIPKGATMAQLQKYAKAGGEKGRMARWQLNMRRGKKKSK